MADNMNHVWVISSLLLCFTLGGLAEQCGTQAGGALCPGGLCCSQWGWCGSTIDYCGPGCKANVAVLLLLVLLLLLLLLLLLNPPVASPTSSPGTPSNRCSCTATTLPARPEASTPTTPSFKPPSLSRPSPPPAMMPRARGRLQLSSAKLPTKPPAVGPPPPTVLTHGATASKRKWAEAITVPPATNIHVLQASSTMRGPIQLSWNYNYGQAGKALEVDLLNNPDLVATDPVLSFKAALWFWMTPQSPKPSCHDVITGIWTPSAADVAAGRLPGYGTVTNIINGGLECGIGQDSRVENRIGFFKRYCDILGVDYGDNLDCNSQRPFGYSSLTTGL